MSKKGQALRKLGVLNFQLQMVSFSRGSQDFSGFFIFFFDFFPKLLDLEAKINQNHTIKIPGAPASNTRGLRGPKNSRVPGYPGTPEPGGGIFNVNP